MSAYLSRLKAITVKTRQTLLSMPPSKLSKGAFEPFEGHLPRRVSRIVALREPDPVELEERKGMAMDSVPEPYLDSWARLQCQRPIGVGDAAWRQAIDDAGRFLRVWASLAIEFGWTAGDLFDVPREGKAGGLLWFCAGEVVRAFAPEHAVTEGGRVFARVTRAEWINPYQKGKRR